MQSAPESTPPWAGLRAETSIVVTPRTYVRGWKKWSPPGGSMLQILIHARTLMIKPLPLLGGRGFDNPYSRLALLAAADAKAGQSQKAQRASRRLGDLRVGNRDSHYRSLIE